MGSRRDISREQTLDREDTEWRDHCHEVSWRLNLPTTVVASTGQSNIAKLISSNKILFRPKREGESFTEIGD